LKIGIITFGSRGDVEPLVAMAVGLTHVGHDVYVCAPSDFAELVERNGVSFRPLSVSFQELRRRPPNARGFFQRVMVPLLKARRIPDVLCRDAWKLLQDADAIIHKSGSMAVGYSIARKLGVPSFEVFCAPLEPSKEMRPILAGPRGPMANWVLSECTYQLLWRVFGPATNRFRRSVLDMPPFPFFGPLREYARVGHPTLYHFSPSVVPKPRDWRPDVHVVGFTYLEPPDHWRPPAELQRFLDAGSRPIYIGFGSMPSSRPDETTSMLMEAVRRSGQRVILQSGTAGLGRDGQIPDYVFVVDEIPHSWLFKHVDIVIHHGGSGTTGAAFRAGVPQIVVPHALDQPFWAQRVYELGVSPKPIPLKRLSADRLAAAIREATTDDAMRARAAEMGATIRAEDGVGRTIELFNEYVARFESRGQKPVGSSR
jgi:sterol 3beta-glucosyltransferase